MIRRNGLYENLFGSVSSRLVKSSIFTVEGLKRESVMSSVQLWVTETSSFVDKFLILKANCKFQ